MRCNRCSATLMAVGPIARLGDHQAVKGMGAYALGRLQNRLGL